MTPAQLTTLNAFILADPVMKLLPNNIDGWMAEEILFNQTASGSFIVWKRNVTIQQIGDAINGTELGNLTATNATRLQTFVQLSPAGVNPSLADKRALFADIFSTGGISAAVLLALWKRLATVYEKIYATGVGNDQNPATLVLEGPIDRADIQTAMGH